MNTAILLAVLISSIPDAGRARASCVQLPPPSAPRAEPNDNTEPAGTLKDGRLTLRLVAQPVTWYPDGPASCGVSLNGFAEEGKAPRIPGPLLRVRAGTLLQITVRNALERPMWVRGLRDQTPFVRDSVEIAPGALHEFTFRPNTPGIYVYRARQLGPNGTQTSANFDGQLIGAFLVDPPEGKIDGRVFVLTRWVKRDAGQLVFELNAINGLSWPNTERLTMTAGDTVRWHVINGGNDFHMMHLHGFHFRVLRVGRGGRDRDSLLTGAANRLAVTEPLVPGGSFSLEWVPERIGNWIFHCHLARHMTAAQRLDRMPGASDSADHQVHSVHENHAMSGMAGLVMGLTVKPRPGATIAAEPRARRTLHLFANTRDSVFGSNPGYAFVLQQGAKAPAPDSIRLPSTPIVLTRGEPTEIVVHNRLPMPIGVHWHGIELQSFSDGVAGWSGNDGKIAPLIPAGGTFTAHMTPPRAGTFIYHIHGGHRDELVSGLYGALIVLPPGESIDRATERVFVVSEPPGSRLGSEKSAVVNGSATPAPLDLHVGTTYRLRIIGIPAGDVYQMRLLKGAEVIHWRPLARDGADVPPDTPPEPARLIVAAGMTRDFAFTPAEAGEYSLVLDVLQPTGAPSGQVTRVSIRVRPR